MGRPNNHDSIYGSLTRPWRDLTTLAKFITVIYGIHTTIAKYITVKYGIHMGRPINHNFIYGTLTRIWGDLNTTTTIQYITVIYRIHTIIAKYITNKYGTHMGRPINHNCI